MSESIWFLCSLGNAAAVGIGLAAYIWYASERAVRRVLEEAPASGAEDDFFGMAAMTAVELTEADVDSADQGEPAQLRARVRRSVEEMESAISGTVEASTKASGTLMTILENQANVVASVGRLAAEGDLPEAFKEQATAILEQLRAQDDLVIEAQETMDQVEASLQTCASELAQYGASSEFDWTELRPSAEGLNRLISRQAQSGDLGAQAQDSSIPPALAQAIDEALI